MKLKDEGIEESVEMMFLIGQRVMIIGGSQRGGDLYDVAGMLLKRVWFKTFNGRLFLERKHRVVVEVQWYTIKHETD